MVLDIADAYSGAASAAAGVGLAPLFALESETRLLGLALSVPVLALLLLVSLRMELRGRSAGLKLQDAHAAWALAELPSPVQALSRGVRYLAAVVMRAGPVPRHVAFIMDGNRRWAKQLGVKTLNGHTAGYEAMCGILEHCKDLGVEVVTVYAFSIENFKRDQAEVDYIMDLAMRKFEDAVSETGDLFKHKVRVRVLGDLTLLPRSVREASARITFATAKNTGPICNICLSYTSRQEIAATVRSVVEGVREGVLEADDCDVALLSRAMYTADLPTPELLVRTSGETRLSDFMLWQCASAHLAFTPVLWPSFSWWQLMKILLDYQRHYPALAARRAHHEQLQASTDLQRQLVVLQAEKEEEEASGAAGGAKRRRKQQQQQRQQQRIVEEEEGKDGLAGQETQQIEAAGSVAKRQLQRQERVEGFLQKLAETRQTSLKALLLQEVEKQSRVQ
jgi:ditrans,polycis-polyprenyl diphosphate synthase